MVNGVSCLSRMVVSLIGYVKDHTYEYGSERIGPSNKLKTRETPDRFYDDHRTLVMYINICGATDP